MLFRSLFEKHGIGITDIFLEVRRKDNSNSDSNLEIIKHNNETIGEIIKNPKIKSIFFTSKFVEKIFRKSFPAVTIAEYLPSPSPRHAAMTMEEKIRHYKSKLPQ